MLRTMFRHTQPKPSSKPKQPVFPSEVRPQGKVSNKSKETFPQSLMNYDVIRDKVQSQLVATVAETKIPGGKRKLLNF